MKILFKFLAIIAMFLSISTLACESPEYRQFDFWIGHWEVTTQGGKVAGTNNISKHLGECTLLESYETPVGYKGTSFNIYDRVTGNWHQTWVDNSGLLLQLSGGLIDLEEDVKAMQLQGPGKAQDGTPITHRITWAPNPNGTVRQHWEASKDEENWVTIFDGTYTKK